MKSVLLLRAAPVNLYSRAMSFSLSWMVPLLLDSMVAVAVAIYNYFVRDGTGIIHAIIWGFVAFWIGMYLAKMYIPQSWLQLFGFHGGGQMWNKETPGGLDIGKTLLKPVIRAMFSIAILLQAKPEYITRFIVNPFLEFGAVYVGSIIKIVMPDGVSEVSRPCSDETVVMLSERGCEFLIRPIDEVSAVNMTIVNRGLGFVKKGGFLNIITGLFLIATFFWSNLVMAVMMIRGIFKFGAELIFYPFRVLVYVLKGDDEKWFDPWPAVHHLVKSLQTLVITMIALAFMLLINVSLARAMFDFSTDNVSTVTQHSISWISCGLAFWLLQRVYAEVDRKIKEYINDDDITTFYDKLAAGVAVATKRTYEWGKRAVQIAISK